MRRPTAPALRRPALLGLPAVAAVALVLGACHHTAPTQSPAPTPTSATSTGAGSDGLTVRYLGDDGTIRTVGVEDFPR